MITTISSIPVYRVNGSHPQNDEGPEKYVEEAREATRGNEKREAWPGHPMRLVGWLWSVYKRACAL